ncbi:hypothetical protein [Gymnodinialimonas ulvae]|uniref:hypothetical protein n=1 Tax=Gymnodinialimonas ulvae TaxID=3126504 RepID=UPI0030A73386
MSLTLPALPLPALPLLARFRRPALPEAGPMSAPEDTDETRAGRAAAMNLMDHCPDALASENDFHAMMYVYAGRY